MNMRSSNGEDFSLALSDGKLNYLVQGNLVIFFVKVLMYPFSDNRNLLVPKNNP